jgi:hypothetical protein
MRNCVRSLSTIGAAARSVFCSWPFCQSSVPISHASRHAEPARRVPTRSLGPATAVVVNGTAYLVDVGAGVVRRAKAASTKVFAPLNR